MLRGDQISLFCLFLKLQEENKELREQLSVERGEKLKLQEENKELREQLRVEKEKVTKLLEDNEELTKTCRELQKERDDTQEGKTTLI